MFRKRVPRWVADLPNDSINKELLTQLINASKKPLDTPREINFVIMDLPTREAAENAIVQLEERGWICKTNPDPRNSATLHLEATKRGYKITDTIFEDEAYIARIAKMYGALYDGWYAQVV